MAEKGAHLTGTTHAKPTIFEIVAQESLASTLEPAFKKLFSHNKTSLRHRTLTITSSIFYIFYKSYFYVEFLATCNPERYEWILQWSDEVYFVFHAFLQKFYLNKYAASFAESFYGLKRISLLESTVGGSLSGKQQKFAVILLILYPYLRAKAEKYKLDEIDGRFPKTLWKKNLRSCFVKILTIYHYIRESSSLFYYVMYISGQSQYPTPIYQMLRTTLTYSGAQEIVTISELLRKLRDGSFHTGDGVQLLQRTFTRSLELGAFFLQFVQWWNQENYSTNLMTLPVPPAPIVPASAKSYKGLCPICRKNRRIHTALSVSGYVFCYQCILPIVRKYGLCPVTRIPAKEDDLIRLYVDE